MKTLENYLNGNFLAEGDPELLEKLRPAFVTLINRLKDLGPNAAEEDRLEAFAKAFDLINRHEGEIETVERETILEAIYHIGEIVGLSRETQFAEEWRGDW